MRRNFTPGAFASGLPLSVIASALLAGTILMPARKFQGKNISRIFLPSNLFAQFPLNALLKSVKNQASSPAPIAPKL
jgi:hypothetical protein